MRVSPPIQPITIHHYRNLTETTQNTISLKSNNISSSRKMSRAEKKLKQIMNKFDEEQSRNIPVRQKISDKKQRHKISRTNSKSKVSKYQFIRKEKNSSDYEPVLSSINQSKRQNSAQKNPQNNSQIDIKQYTFGQKYYDSNQNQHQKSNFDLVTNRTPQKIKKQNEISQRRKDFATHLQKNRQQYDKKQKKDKGQSTINEKNSQRRVERQSNQVNFQLHNFTRQKGLQYLRDVSIKVRTQSLKKLENKTEKQTLKHLPKINGNRTNNERRIYPNYIPQVFPKLPHSTNSKKKIKTEITSQQTKKIKKQQTTKQYQKYCKINDREQMLGKLVLDKVQEHFTLTKQKKNNYFATVKSEQTIDEAWIEYLRTKVDRAEYALLHH